MLKLLLSNFLMVAIIGIYNLSFASQHIDLKNKELKQRDNMIENLSKEVESLLISKTLKSVYEGIKVDSVTGGGETEKIYRDLLIDEYAKEITKKGGIGLKESVMKDIKKTDSLYKKLERLENENK